jgi:hypothetical protein
MKFRFCNGMDAPDWLLGEVATLSKFSSVRMKLLLRELTKALCGEALNQEKVRTLTTSKRVTWSRSDVHALIAALNFILTNSAKHAVEPATLKQELEQLGLPSDICKTIQGVYAANAARLVQTLRGRVLGRPRLLSCEYRVDCLLASDQKRDLLQANVRLNLGLSAKPGGKRETSFEVAPDLFHVLRNELTHVHAQMQKLS